MAWNGRPSTEMLRDVADQLQKDIAEKRQKQSKRTSAKTNSEIQRAECEQRLAVMSQRIDQLVQEKMEEIAEKRQKQSKRTSAKTNSEIQRAECEQRLAVMSQRIDQLVQEKMEIQKAECEQRLAVMSQTIDKLAQEEMEIQRAEYEQRLAVMSQTIDKLAQEKMEDKAEYDQRLAVMSDTMDKVVQEKMQIQKAECEQRLAVMSQTIDKLAQEKMEDKAEYDQRLAVMSETMDKVVLEKMQIQRAECEQRLALMFQTIDKLVLEKMEEKADYEQRLAALSETMDKVLQEKMQENGQTASKLVALEKRTFHLEKAAQGRTVGKAVLQPDMKALEETMDLLILATAEEKARTEKRLASLEEDMRDFHGGFWDVVSGASSKEDVQDLRRRVDRLVQEKVQMIVLQSRISQLERSALEKSEFQRTECKQRFDVTSQLVLEKMEIQRAECEQRLAVMSQTIDELAQEKMEIQRAECEQRLAVMSQTIEKLAQEKMEIQRAECEQRLAVMSLTIDKLAQEKMEDKAEYERRLAVMSETMDKVVQEIMEERGAQVADKSTNKVVALENRAPDPAQTAQAEAGDPAQTAQAEAGDPAQTAQAEPGDPALTSLAEARDPAQTAQAEARDPAQTAQAEAHDPVQTAQAEARDPALTAQAEAHDPAQTTQAEARDPVQTAQAEESVEFQGEMATMKETIDSIYALFLSKRLESFQEVPANKNTRFLTPILETEEETTDESMDPTTVEPTASGSHDPSSVQLTSSRGVQSNSSRGVQSNNFGSEEETPIASTSTAYLGQMCASSAPTLADQAEIRQKVTFSVGDGILDSSTVSQPQEEVRLPSPNQSLKKKRKTEHCDVPDESLLDPDLEPALKMVFLLLNSDEREEIKEGLEIMTDLADQEPKVLIPKIEEVCVVILREVLSQWEDVSSTALWTLAYLIHSLKEYFHPYLNWIMDAMLKKGVLDDKTFHEAADELLSTMMSCCNPIRCVEALLNGLSNLSKQDPHQTVAARERIALFLLGLVRVEEPTFLLDFEPEMLLNFITTLSDLTQDSSEIVRYYADKTLRTLSVLQEVNDIVAQAQY